MSFGVSFFAIIVTQHHGHGRGHGKNESSKDDVNGF